MSRIDEVRWKKMEAAFRDKPGNIRNASIKAGVDRETAYRAWHEGYPNAHRRPLKEVQEEAEADRAALAKVKADAIKAETAAFAAALRGDVRSNALEEYERTNQYLRAASMTATAALVAVHRLQPVVQELGLLAPRLVDVVHRELVEGEMTAKQAMEMLEKIAGFTKAVAATSNSATLQGAKVVEVSRMRASDNVINVKEVVGSEPFDPNEAKRIAAELAEAAMEVESAGESGPVLSVVSGGKAQGE